jgi:hypothetical protein
MNKMTHTTRLVAALVAVPGLALAGSSLAQTFDGSKALLCAVSEIMVCEPVVGCERVTAESVNAPRFIRIDPQSKTITATRAELSKRTSTIENVENLDGKFIIQGIEDGQDTVRDGLGWSLTVSEERGTMVLTAAAEDIAFTAFGACTVPEATASE